MGDRSQDTLIDVVCMCGERIFVTLAGPEHVYECTSCRLPFTLVVETRPDGRRAAAPMFIDVTPKEEEDELPEPPEEMMLLCICGHPLKIKRRLYNHRVQCPHCAARMALVLKLDTTCMIYRLDAHVVEGPSLGDTHILTRASA